MIRENRFGLENLSFIPGLVGAAPVQNIGAYGVELSDRFVSLKALDRRSGEEIELNKSDCEFAYRESLFKKKFKNQLVITSISLSLDRVYKPILEYKDLRSRFSETVTALEVSDALIEIRSFKLPDPNIMGNVGSFFKNPYVSESHYQKLESEITFSAPKRNTDDTIKIPAALLIAGAQLQGKRIGDVVVSPQHALVLCNVGSANSRDVKSLIEYIQEKVQRKYNVELEVEPELIT